MVVISVDKGVEGVEVIFGFWIIIVFGGDLGDFICVVMKYYWFGEGLWIFILVFSSFLRLGC